jgi:hypothetical protein
MESEERETGQKNGTGGTCCPVSKTPDKPERIVRPVRYLCLPEVQDAIDTLKVWWPGLFKGEAPHLLAIGIREAFLRILPNGEYRCPINRSLNA